MHLQAADNLKYHPLAILLAQHRYSYANPLDSCSRDLYHLSLLLLAIPFALSGTLASLQASVYASASDIEARQLCSAPASLVTLMFVRLISRRQDGQLGFASFCGDVTLTKEQTRAGGPSYFMGVVTLSYLTLFTSCLVIAYAMTTTITQKVRTI